MGQLRGDETTALLKTQAFSAIPRHSQVFPVVLSCARLCVAVRGSLASEWCRCGASQKRVPRDSTKTYSPWYSTFWDVPQMRRYHDKGLVSEGRRVLHSAKMPSMGSTCAYVPLTAFFVRGRNRPLITKIYSWW